MNLEELESELIQVKQTTPILEELCFSFGIQSWVDGNGAVTRSPLNHRATIFIAPMACRILSASVSFEYWTCAANDTNFWEFSLEKGSGVSFPNIAYKTTQITGTNANGGILPRTAWTMDSANWGNADMAKGQLLAVNLARVGTPPTIAYPAAWTVRYRPL